MLTVIAVLVVLAAGLFALVASGALIGPENPRSGPEIWVVDDDRIEARGAHDRHRRARDRSPE